MGTGAATVASTDGGADGEAGRGWEVSVQKVIGPSTATQKVSNHLLRRYVDP